MCFKKTSLKLAYENGVLRCPCCGIQLVWKAHTSNVQKNLATVDHIVPQSIGGADTTENMFVMCRKCNEFRGNSCFVTFVTERGVSKSLAETLYKKAYIATLQTMIMIQFNHVIEDKKQALKINKKRRGQIQKMIKNYTEYFGDYLPEFQLLQRLI
jgi:hypothetical protein